MIDEMNNEMTTSMTQGRDTIVPGSYPGQNQFRKHRFKNNNFCSTTFGQLTLTLTLVSYFANRWRKEKNKDNTTFSLFLLALQSLYQTKNHQTKDNLPSDRSCLSVRLSRSAIHSRPSSKKVTTDGIDCFVLFSNVKIFPPNLKQFNKECIDVSAF